MAAAWATWITKPFGNVGQASGLPSLWFPGGTRHSSEAGANQPRFIASAECANAVASPPLSGEDESRKGLIMETTESGVNEKSEVRAKLEAAIEKAKDACERLEEKTVAAAKATDKAVREHPYQAVGIAFGVGILIGVLVARCRRGGD